MANGSFVAYFRVSTQQQGRSGLGLEAQKAAVVGYLNGGNWQLVGEYVEVETGKGSNALAKRPQLRAALDLCKKRKATLLIAKLDRLARNVHFVSGLIEEGVDFVAVDMPQANKVMLHMHAVMSEWERDQISARTKAALQAAKERGISLGKAGPRNLRANVEQRQHAAHVHAMNLAPMLEGLLATGRSQRSIVEELNRLKIAASRGGSKWTLSQLQRALKRIC